jgi:hypothetical protein
VNAQGLLSSHNPQPFWPAAENQAAWVECLPLSISVTKPKIFPDVLHCCRIAQTMPSSIHISIGIVGAGAPALNARGRRSSTTKRSAQSGIWTQSLQSLDPNLSSKLQKVQKQQSMLVTFSWPRARSSPPWSSAVIRSLTRSITWTTWLQEPCDNHKGLHDSATECIGRPSLATEGKRSQKYLGGIFEKPNRGDEVACILLRTTPGLHRNNV